MFFLCVKTADQFCILGNGTTAAPVTPSGQQHIHGGRMGGGGKVLGESASLRSHDSIHHNMDTLAVPGALDEKLNYSDMRYAHSSPPSNEVRYKTVVNKEGASNQILGSPDR